MKKALRIYSAKQLVHHGPGMKFPAVEAFPSGLPRGKSIGIDKEENGYGRLIGTDWWVFIGYKDKA